MSDKEQTPITHETLLAAGAECNYRDSWGYKEYVMNAPNNNNYFSPFVYALDHLNKAVIYVINDNPTTVVSGIKDGGYVVKNFNLLHFPGVTSIEELLALYLFSFGEPYKAKGAV